MCAEARWNGHHHQSQPMIIRRSRLPSPHPYRCATRAGGAGPVGRERLADQADPFGFVGDVDFGLECLAAAGADDGGDHVRVRSKDGGDDDLGTLIREQLRLASPMPWAPPVMIATLSFRRITVLRPVSMRMSPATTVPLPRVCAAPQPLGQCPPRAALRHARADSSGGRSAKPAKCLRGEFGDRSAPAMICKLATDQIP